MDINIDATIANLDTVDPQVAKEMRMDMLACDLDLPTYSDINKSLVAARSRNDYFQQQTANHERKIRELKEYLAQTMADGDIDEEVAETIGDIFGIELNETSVMTLTVQVTVTHKIGKRDDIDESDVDITIDGGYSNGVEVEEWEVTDCQVSEQ